MIILFLIVQALLCGTILYREVAVKKCRNFASSVFYAIYAAVYIFEPLVLHIFFDGARSIVNGVDTPFRDEMVYMIFNIIGIALLTTGLIISTFRTENVPVSYELDFDTKRVADTIGMLIVLGLFLFVYATGSSFGELLLASRFAWFESDTFRLEYSVASSYLIALTPIYIYLACVKANHSKAILVMSLLAVVTYGVITKDRKWIFYIVSGWLAAKYHQGNYRIAITRKTAVIMLSLFPLILMSQFLRDAIPRYFMNEDVDFIGGLSGWFSNLFEYSDLSYFYRATIEAIHQNVNNGYYIVLGLVRRVLFFALPAGYSGGLKVEDMSAIFSDLVGGGDDLRRGSMPPGLFGSFVLSFGWVGAAAVMPLFALLLAKFDRIFRGKGGAVQLALMTIYLTSVIFAFRGDESTAFYFSAANVLMLACLVAVSRIKLF